MLLSNLPSSSLLENQCNYIQDTIKQETNPLAMYQDLQRYHRIRVSKKEKGSQLTGAWHPLQARPVQDPPCTPPSVYSRGLCSPPAFTEEERAWKIKGLSKAMQSGSQEPGSRDVTVISPLSHLPLLPLPFSPLPLSDTAGSHLSLYPVHLCKVAPRVRQICTLFLGATL